MNFERGQDPKRSMGIGKAANIWWVESVYERSFNWSRQVNVTGDPKVLKILEEMLDGTYRKRKYEYLFTIRNARTGRRMDVNRKKLWGKWISYEGELFKLPTL